MLPLLLLLSLQPVPPPDFEPLYRQALAERERKLGPTASLTLQSKRDLALYLAARGQYSAAAPFVEPALATAATPEAATVLHNWAVALEESDSALAERLYRQALLLRAKALPALDVELATTRLNLAGLLLAKANPAATPLARLALAAFEKQLGPNDTRTGAACGILGALRAIQGDVPGAEQFFRRALAIAEHAHGPQAPETASALENLADLLAQTGRELAARPLLQRAQQIRSRPR